MVRTKPIPRKYPRDFSTKNTSGMSLPMDVRRLIFEFAPPDIDTFFQCMWKPIDRSDRGCFFNTGQIRYKFVFTSGHVLYGFIEPSKSIPKYDECTVYAYASDKQQARLFRTYERSLFGSRPCFIGKMLDAARWEPMVGWHKSKRFSENIQREDEKIRAKNQVIRRLQTSNCETHSFHIGFISQKIYPDEPEKYIRGDIRTSYFSKLGIRFPSGSGISEINERTLDLDAGYSSDYATQTSLSGYETDSEYESEYDERTGEKIESIRLADYDEEDKLYFKKPTTVRIKWGNSPGKRIPNKHLKNSRNETIFEPLSWRLSVNPCWRSSRTGEFIPPHEDDSMVIGQRHEFFGDVSELVHLWENKWVPWYREESVDPGIELMQHYHIGIEKAFRPQNSFVDLVEYNRNNAVIPLLEIEESENEDDEPRLMISHYTLVHGLKSMAVPTDDFFVGDGLVQHPDSFYI